MMPFPFYKNKNNPRKKSLKRILKDDTFGLRNQSRQHNKLKLKEVQEDLKELIAQANEGDKGREAFNERTGKSFILERFLTQVKVNYKDHQHEHHEQEDEEAYHHDESLVKDDEQDSVIDHQPFVQEKGYQPSLFSGSNLEHEKHYQQHQHHHHLILNNNHHNHTHLNTEFNVNSVIDGGHKTANVGSTSGQNDEHDRASLHSKRQLADMIVDEIVKIADCL